MRGVHLKMMCDTNEGEVVGRGRLTWASPLRERIVCQEAIAVSQVSELGVIAFG